MVEIDAELDKQYNARTTVPDSADWIAHYSRLGEQVQSWRGFQVPPAYGVSYGPGPSDRMDIFPAPHAGSPVFVFIHGGYWRALSRIDGIFMAPLFHLAGATVVSLDYALAPGSGLPEITAQVGRALKWIARHVERYNGDPHKIHISGHSAGAHLAAMQLLREPESASPAVGDVGTSESDRLPHIQSASLFSGLFDLRPLLKTHINDWLQLDEAGAHAMSPMVYAPRSGCRVVVAFGANESQAFRWQSETFAREWSSHAGMPPVVCMALPGKHHFDCPLTLTDPGLSVTQAVFACMGLTPPSQEADFNGRPTP